MVFRYMDPENGLDTNNGLSPTTPRKTPPTLLSGDKLFLKTGTIYRRSTQWGFGLVTDIEISSYGDLSLGKPIIEIGTVSFNAIAIQSERTVFRNLIFRNFRDLNAVPGINRPNGIAVVSKGVYDTDPAPDTFEIYDCEFYNIPGDAIALNGFNLPIANALGTNTAIIRRCVFDYIGGDAIFAKVRKYFEVGHCKMTRVSIFNATGDGVGFLDCNPEFAWVHHCYIDHRDVDSKQCIIIDGLDNTGLAVIEDNILLGWGTADTSPTLHVNLNVDACRAIIRRNYIETSGIGITVNADGPIINSNIVVARRHATDGSGTVVMLVSNGMLINNTLVNTGSNSGYTLRTGSGRSGNVIKNNIVVGGNIFFKQATSSTSSNGNNCFFNVDTPYVNAADVPLANDASDRVVDPLLDKNYIPTSLSPILKSGSYVGNIKDITGKYFSNPPSIGARQYRKSRRAR